MLSLLQVHYALYVQKHNIMATNNKLTSFIPVSLINPLTPETFCKKCIFGAFWSFSGWISAKLPLIQSKIRLQHNSLPFLPPASRFSALWLRHAQKVTYVFRLFNFWNFFCLSFFSFSLLFAAVINLLLGLLAIKKLLRKRHRGGQFLAWSSQV